MALNKERRTATREEPNSSVLPPMLEGSPALYATPLPAVPPGEEPTAAMSLLAYYERQFANRVSVGDLGGAL